MRDIRIRDSIPNLVARLFRQMARVHNKALKPLELTAVQAHILTVLYVEGPLTIGEIQRTMAFGSSTLTGALDRMEALGLCSRTAVEGDRRSYRVEPVALPAKKKSALFDCLVRTEDAALADLTAAERTALARLLAKATASAERLDDA